MPKINFKGLQEVGVVCSDDSRLSPVASRILRDLAIRSSKASVRQIQFWDAGINRSDKISDAAKGFLQTRGFGTSSLMEVKRVDKYWIKTKDLILTSDRFIKREIVFNFPITNIDLNEKVFTLPEAAGINERIQDFKEDYNIDSSEVYELIERCCIALIKKIEAQN